MSKSFNLFIYLNYCVKVSFGKKHKAQTFFVSVSGISWTTLSQVVLLMTDCGMFTSQTSHSVVRRWGGLWREEKCEAWSSPRVQTCGCDTFRLIHLLPSFFHERRMRDIEK